MTMRCRNGQEHTHETVAQSRQCWLGRPSSAGQAATLAQPRTDSAMAKEARCLECGQFHRGGASCAPVATAPKVASGRYAVTLPREDKIRFFIVKVGRVRTFLDEQASDSTYPVQGRNRQALVLATIASDPEALARYGRELGVCGRCGRTLTDEESRAAGIGPICRGK